MNESGRNRRGPDSLDHRADRAARGGDQGPQRGQEGSFRRGQGRGLRRQGAERDPQAAQARPRRARRAGIAARPLHARDGRSRAAKSRRLIGANGVICFRPPRGPGATRALFHVRGAAPHDWRLRPDHRQGPITNFKNCHPNGGFFVACLCATRRCHISIILISTDLASAPCRGGTHERRALAKVQLALRPAREDSDGQRRPGRLPKQRRSIARTRTWPETRLP